MEDINILKARRFLGKNYMPIATIVTIIMLATGVIGCLMAYNSMTGTEEITNAAYTQQGVYTYSATVIPGNPLYADNTVLHMGNPAYFFEVSPIADMEFQYSIDSTKNVDVTATGKTSLIVTSMDGDKTIWQKTYPVNDMGSIKIKDNQPVNSKFAINMTNIQTQINDVQDKLKYSPTTTYVLTTQINYAGTINDQPVADTAAFNIPINMSDTYYQMPDSIETSSTSKTTYDNITVATRKAPTVKTTGLPIIFIVLEVIALNYIVTRRRSVTDEDIAAAEKVAMRGKFKESISTGSLPNNINMFTLVDITSLRELVDIAMDTNTRVIYNKEAHIYYTLTGSIMYRFDEEHPVQGYKKVEIGGVVKHVSDVGTRTN